jgi:hypothetical protein
MPELNTITGTDLHWPRGIESASTSDAGKVLTPSASSAGTGELRNLTESEISGKTEYITAVFDDVSTAGDIYIPMNFAGTVTSVRSVLHGAIATADVTLAVKVNGVTMTNGNIVIAFTDSAAGDLDSCTPTAGNTVTTSQYLQVTSDGASTNAVSATLMFTITRS